MALIQVINVSTPNDGLGDTLRESQVIANSNFDILNEQKVEVELGKGLSDNNYTDEEFTKLGGIEAGAQVNVQADWNQEDPGEDSFILNKPTISDGTIFIMDGIVGVTVGFAVGQQDFTLPTPTAVVKHVYLAHQLQYMHTPTNGSFSNRWEQVGDVLHLSKYPLANNYLYIEYE